MKITIDEKEFPVIICPEKAVTNKLYVIHCCSSSTYIGKIVVMTNTSLMVCLETGTVWVSLESLPKTFKIRELPSGTTFKIE